MNISIRAMRTESRLTFRRIRDDGWHPENSLRSNMFRGRIHVFRVVCNRRRLNAFHFATFRFPTAMPCKFIHRRLSFAYPVLILYSTFLKVKMCFSTSFRERIKNCLLLAPDSRRINPAVPSACPDPHPVSQHDADGIDKFI
jgi:hypothetical protein